MGSHDDTPGDAGLERTEAEPTEAPPLDPVRFADEGDQQEEDGPEPGAGGDGAPLRPPSEQPGLPTDPQNPATG